MTYNDLRFEAIIGFWLVEGKDGKHYVCPSVLYDGPIADLKDISLVNSWNSHIQIPAETSESPLMAQLPTLVKIKGLKKPIFRVEDIASIPKIKVKIDELTKKYVS